jgi:hypothetical protein
MVVCLAMCACYAMSIFAATGGAKEQPVGAGMAGSREAFWTQSYLDPVEAFRGRSREAAAVRGHKELA